MSCFFGVSNEQEKVNQLNSEITSLKKEVLKLKQENTELKDTIVFNTAVVHSNSDDDSDNDVTPPPNEDSKQSELKQELQKVTQDRDSLLKENQELSSNFELFQTKAKEEIEKLRAKLQAIESVKNDYFQSQSNEISSSLDNEIQDLKAQNKMLEASKTMLKQKNESQQKEIDNLKQQLKDGKNTKSVDEEKVESKPKKNKKYNLNKVEDQIEVLHSESLKYTSMSDKVVDQLFSKFKQDSVDGKQLEQLLTLTVIIYKVKLHKMRTGSTDKPKLESSSIKRSVEHLTSWIIRNYGTKTDKKQSVSVKSDSGEMINGEYFIYNAKFDKNTFGNDVKDWVMRYVEDDGYIKIE